MLTPPKGQPYEFYLSLIDSADPSEFKVNPTISAGDFRISKDGDAFVSLANTPVVTPTNSALVQVSLSADEMNAGSVYVEAIDRDSGEWQQVTVFIGIGQSIPIRGNAYVLYLSLVDANDPTRFKANPTIEAGDFQISKDGGPFLNLETTPEVRPSGDVAVKVSLSPSEMNSNKVSILGKDQAGEEWQEVSVFIDAPSGTTTIVKLDGFTLARDNTKGIHRSYGNRNRDLR